MTSGSDFPNRERHAPCTSNNVPIIINKDTHASRLLGHSRQVCTALIPSSLSGETSQDDSLHKVYISCSTFRGKYNNGINQLFRDNLHEIYDRLFDIDAEPIDISENYYTAIATATEVAG